MALELRVEGPGLDVVRRLEAGQPELVLGRGSECDVCPPDPRRKVSRKHLSVWLEAGELQFHVHPERALGELLHELITHGSASGKAVGAMVAATLDRIRAGQIEGQTARERIPVACQHAGLGCLYAL